MPEGGGFGRVGADIAGLGAAGAAGVVFGLLRFVFGDGTVGGQDGDLVFGAAGDELDLVLQPSVVVLPLALYPGGVGLGDTGSS